MNKIILLICFFITICLLSYSIKAFEISFNKDKSFIELIKSTDFTEKDQNYLIQQFEKIDILASQYKLQEAISEINTTIKFMLSYEESSWDPAFYDIIYFLTQYRGDMYVHMGEPQKAFENYKVTMQFLQDTIINTEDFNYMIYYLSPLSKIGMTAIELGNNEEKEFCYKNIKSILNDLGGTLLDISRKDFSFAERHLPQILLETLQFKYLYLANSDPSIMLDFDNIDILSDYKFLMELNKNYSFQEMDAHTRLQAIGQTLQNMTAILYGMGEHEKIDTLFVKFLSSYNLDNLTLTDIFAVTPVLTTKVQLQQQNFNRNYETYFEDVNSLRQLIPQLIKKAIVEKHSLAVGLALNSLGKVDNELGNSSEVLIYISKYLNSLEDKGLNDYNSSSKWMNICPLMVTLGEANALLGNLEEAIYNFNKVVSYCSNGVFEYSVYKQIIDIYIDYSFDPKKGLELFEKIILDLKILNNDDLDFTYQISRAQGNYKIHNYHLAIKQSYRALNKCNKEVLYEKFGMEQQLSTQDEKQLIKVCELMALSIIAASEAKLNKCSNGFDKYKNTLLSFDYKWFVNMILEGDLFSRFQETSKIDYTFLNSNEEYISLNICEKDPHKSSELFLKKFQMENNIFLRESLIRAKKIKSSNNKDLINMYKKLENIKYELNIYSGSFDENIYGKMEQYIELNNSLELNNSINIKNENIYVTLQDITKKLKNNEATIILSSGIDKTFALFISGKKTTKNNIIKSYVIDLSIEEIIDYEKSIRKSLNLKNTLNFDVNLSKKLYRILFGEIHKEIQDIDNLIILSEGPLNSIPLNILIINDDQEFNKKNINSNDIVSSVGIMEEDFFAEGKSLYRSFNWFGLKYSITHITTLDIFKTINDKKDFIINKDEFIAFGDPKLSISNDCIEDSRNIYKLFKNDEELIVDINSLCSLPHAKKEIQNIAKIINAEENNIFTQDNATEENVKSAYLKNKKLILFATHGLIAGDFNTLKEPALIFTPPKKLIDDNDGLLKASEIVTLDLNANLVILSACNTASGLNSNTDNLSGLSKAFFIAGADSLLVSQWPVSDQAASMLTTDIVSILKNNPALKISEALKLSMNNLLYNSEELIFTHPGVWAPFMFVSAN